MTLIISFLMLKSCDQEEKLEVVVVEILRQAAPVVSNLEL